MSGTREKLRALLLVAIMIGSVFALAMPGAASSVNSSNAPSGDVSVGSSNNLGLEFTMASDDTVIQDSGNLQPGDKLDDNSNFDTDDTFIDANNNGNLDPGEAIIVDSNDGFDGSPASGTLQDADSVVFAGSAGLTSFGSEEQFVDVQGAGLDSNEFDTDGSNNPEPIYQDSDSNDEVSAGDSRLSTVVVDTDATSNSTGPLTIAGKQTTLTAVQSSDADAQIDAGSFTPANVLSSKPSGTLSLIGDNGAGGTQSNVEPNIDDVFLDLDGDGSIDPEDPLIVDNGVDSTGDGLSPATTVTGVDAVDIFGGDIGGGSSDVKQGVRFDNADSNIVVANGAGDAEGDVTVDEKDGSNDIGTVRVADPDGSTNADDGVYVEFSGGSGNANTIDAADSDRPDIRLRGFTQTLSGGTSDITGDIDASLYNNLGIGSLGLSDFASSDRYTDQSDDDAYTNGEAIVLDAGLGGSNPDLLESGDTVEFEGSAQLGDLDDVSAEFEDDDDSDDTFDSDGSDAIVQNGDSTDTTAEGSALDTNGDVDNSYGDAVVDVTVTNDGSLSDSDLSQIQIYAESSGNSQFNPGSDTLLTSTSTKNSNKDQFELTGITDSQALFGDGSSSSDLSSAQTTKFYITYDVSSGASANNDVDLRVPGLQDSDNTFSGGDRGLFLESADDTGDVSDSNTQTVSASSLAGGDGTVSYDIGGSQNENVLAGSADQELSQISIKDQVGGEFRGTVDLAFGPAVTVNESASELNTNTVVPSSSDISIDAVNVINNSHTIQIDVSGASNAGERIDIASGALHVETNGSVIDTADANDGELADNTLTELPADIETFGNTLNIRRTGGDVNNGFLRAGQIETNTPGGTTLTADSTNTPIGNNIILQDVDQNEIGDNTEVVLSLQEGTGVTFDQSVDPTDPAIVGGTLDVDGVDNEELDVDNATLTETSLTVPINDTIDNDGNTITFNGNQIALNATGSATATDINVSVAAESPNTGAYQLGSLSSGVKDPTFNDEISVDSPNMDFNADNSDGDGVALIGANEQNTVSEGSNANLRVDLSSGLSGSKFLNITTNSSAVTFDTSETASDDTTAFDASNNIGNSDINNVTITEDTIAIGINNGVSSGSSEDLVLGFESGSPFKLNVSADAADNSKVQFNGTYGPISFSDTTDVLRLESPDTSLNGGSNITLDTDADGQTSVTKGSNGGSPDAIQITGDDIAGQAQPGTFVNVTIESGTGVTFDTSAPISTGAGSANEIDVTQGAGTVNFNNVSVSERTIAIGLGTGSNDGLDQTSPDDRIDIDEIVLNATSDAANTSVSVTTNNGDNKVTTDFENIIATNAVSPSKLAVDADLSDNSKDFSNGQVDAVNNPQVDNSAAGAVRVQNGGDFGGADVNLEIVETPEGSSGSSLNTTLLTTDQNGEAFYNFTAGDTTGDYVLNVSIDGVSGGLNVTYTAQPGSVAGVNVTPIENAIAGDSAETGVAALFVNSTDANGNRVTGSSPTVEITADNVGASEVDSTDDFDNTKNSVGGLSGGTFSLHATDGSSVVYVKSSQVEDVTISATISGESDNGTVTFFDQVGGIDLSLNETSVAVDDTVTADATITEEDGTTIEVPDVTVDFDDNNDGNTTFDANADSESATTNANGVASVNVTAEQNGTSTIDATSNLRSDSATLTIGSANFEVSDLAPQDATVNVSEAFDVSATVENTGSLQGEQEIELRLEPDGDAVLNQTVSLDPGANTTVTFENVTVDTAGEFNHTVASADDSATGSLTVEQREQEQEPPTATVTFENQTVQNGSTTVNVASATFNGSEAFNIVVHQASDDNDDGTIQASEIGKKIGESAELDNGTRTNITVNISKEVADNDNVSQLTENQTLVAMLHTTNTSDDNNIVHTASIKRDGTPVFDPANITVEEAAEDAPANFAVSGLEPQDATVNVSEAFDVSATVENTGDLQGEQEIELRLEPDGDAVRNQTVSLDAGNSTTVTFDNVTVDTAGEFNHTVASANDSATGSLTVEQREQEQEPPTATVTFENQTVQNGSTTVNVASATFNGSEAFNIVVHQASDDNDDGTIQASEIGKKIGESEALEPGSEPRTNVSVNISKQVADNDNVSQLTENETLVAMLHTTNTSDDDSIVHTAPITRDGTPVFDQADIGIEPESPLDGPAARFDENADGEIDIGELGQAGRAFAAGDLSITELGQVGRIFAR